jgi:hypothetical protein
VEADMDKVSFENECDLLARKVVTLALRSDETLHETIALVNLSMANFLDDLNKSILKGKQETMLIGNHRKEHRLHPYFLKPKMEENYER